MPHVIYPYLEGGDMVLLPTDEIAFADDAGDGLLSPDDSFMPFFFKNLIDATYAVHRAGLLHLDIKPENFVVAGPDRSFFLPATWESLRNYRLVLLDFGLSTSIEEAATQDKCMDVGTAVTMAPEQVMCNGPAGRGTDWWAVAAAMWRVRVFWEPTLDDRERTRLLNLTCPRWGHHVMPDQPFFSEHFRSLLALMLRPTEQERDFSRSPEAMAALLAHPYLAPAIAAA